MDHVLVATIGEPIGIGIMPPARQVPVTPDSLTEAIPCMPLLITFVVFAGC